MPTISLIASVNKNWGIGSEGKLCLSIPGDLRYFKGRTMGCNVIMGRKTFESIGHPLVGRTNVILTSNPNFSVPGEMVLHSLKEVNKFLQSSQKDTFIIGGKSIYEQFLPWCKFAYITENNIETPHDTIFPVRLDKMDDWKLIDKIRNSTCTEFESYFCIYRHMPIIF